MSFKKRTLSNKNTRTKVSGDSDEEDSTTVVRSSDNSKSSSLEFHSSSSLKKTNETDQVDKLGSAVTTVFESSRELVPQSYAGNATHTTEVDPALSRKVVKTFGPVRAPTFVRVTSRFDYQPDICKDYKETGFCGFGDSCKFLHDRGDYKSGWQLEREWETKQLSKKKKLEDSIAAFGDDVTERKVDDDEDDDDNKYAIDSDEEDLPFACFVCREDFVNPIVTVCGHYFCSHCAIEGMKSTSNKCPICNKQTFGVFNRAHKLLKQIALKKGVGESNVDDPSAVSSIAVINAPVKRRGNWETVDS